MATGTPRGSETAHADGRKDAMAPIALPVAVTVASFFAMIATAFVAAPSVVAVTQWCCVAIGGAACVAVSMGIGVALSTPDPRIARRAGARAERRTRDVTAAEAALATIAATTALVTATTALGSFLVAMAEGFDHVVALVDQASAAAALTTASVFALPAIHLAAASARRGIVRRGREAAGHVADMPSGDPRGVRIVTQEEADAALAPSPMPLGEVGVVSEWRTKLAWSGLPHRRVAGLDRRPPQAIDAASLAMGAKAAAAAAWDALRSRAASAAGAASKAAERARDGSASAMSRASAWGRETANGIARRLRALAAWAHGEAWPRVAAALAAAKARAAALAKGADGDGGDGGHDGVDATDGEYFAIVGPIVDGMGDGDAADGADAKATGDGGGDPAGAQPDARPGAVPPFLAGRLGDRG